MKDMFFFIFIPSVIFFGATLLLSKRKAGILKFIPSMIAALVSIGLYIKAFFFSEGFEALGYAVLLMISVPVFAISIITAVVLEIIKRRKAKKALE